MTDVERDVAPSADEPAAEPGPSRRALLIGGSAALITLLGVGVPWTISALHSDDDQPPPAHHPTGSPPGTTRVAARQGAAYQLMAVDPALDPAGRGGPAAAGRLAGTEQAFALALLKNLGSAGNVAISPASLAIALAMLQNGARGRTLDEIQAALQAARLRPADLDAGWSTLISAWAAAAKSDGFQLTSANSVWTQRGLPMQPEFMSALLTWFDAGVWQADFATGRGAAVHAINAWTADQTHGRIPKLFDDLPPDTKAVLANAIYFKAAWQTAFDAHDTHDGDFTTDAGPVTASFMSADQALPCAVTADYSAVQLPYRGGRFAALAIMPTRGTLHDFVATTTVPDLQAVVASLRPSPLALRLPRFTMSATLGLKPVLESLGMATAFTDAADFSGMSRSSLKVDEVVQRVYLSVAEKGTEAAAATGVVMVPTSGVFRRTVLNLDHPFLFLIRDTTTGAILFAARVEHPTV